MKEWPDFLTELKFKIINHMADNNLTIDQIAKEHNYDANDIREFLSLEEDIYIGALYNFCKLIGLQITINLKNN